MHVITLGILFSSFVATFIYLKRKVTMRGANKSYEYISSTTVIASKIRKSNQVTDICEMDLLDLVEKSDEIDWNTENKLASILSSKRHSNAENTMRYSNTPKTVCRVRDIDYESCLNTKRTIKKTNNLQNIPLHAI